jgi:hydrophobic/amphiphilic exporter-1 (mainly G- bacteria), HAE1 family
LLSLLFVPAFFTIMDDAGRVFWWLFGRFLGGSDDPPTKHVATPATDPVPQQAGKPAE